MRARELRVVQGHRWLMIATLTLGLGATLAACASGANSGTAQSTATPTTSSAPTASITQGGSLSPTATPLPGSANLAGVTDICTSKANVTKPLLPELPAYNGQLRLATQTTGGAYEYGYCVTASVDTVANFYKAQLPGKGWTQIQLFVNNATRNLIATRGAEQLTITVSPDVVQTGNADLLIIVSGG